MSRVGKLPINIPKGVSVGIEDLTLTVKGPKGTLSRSVPSDLDFELEETVLKIKRQDDSIRARSIHGLMRALIFNMVHGVSQGFVRALEIQGTGYRADVQNNVLNLSLGFSHPVLFPMPEGITATVEKQTTIRLEGIDREVLGQTAARIRMLRPAEPYKGKGVRYVGEFIHRKAGKTGSKK